ncbi:MAG TPA: hypothetical protein VLA61_18630 [Ideonella sp.]|uniref:hypothetical protein n=1 Tax=Ideonella sp. TaxID=1929293 RepID=UPI002CF1E748|nr:hypothetical protein [Ideonella sp.]HSI50292.1 hypothetical protein [Ideonella sp.]
MIIVDDGLATGSSMLAAVQTLAAQRHPHQPHHRRRPGRLRSVFRDLVRTAHGSAEWQHIAEACWDARVELLAAQTTHQQQNTETVSGIQVLQEPRAVLTAGCLVVQVAEGRFLVEHRPA